MRLLTELVADNFDQSSRTFVSALRSACRGSRRTRCCGAFIMLGTIYYSASPAADQGVFARPLRSWRRRGDGAASIAVLAAFRSAAVARPAVAAATRPKRASSKRSARKNRRRACHRGLDMRPRVPLRTLLGDHPATHALRQGTLASPIDAARFRRRRGAEPGLQTEVRDLEFDAAELALMTCRL